MKDKDTAEADLDSMLAFNREMFRHLVSAQDSIAKAQAAVKVVGIMLHQQESMVDIIKSLMAENEKLFAFSASGQQAEEE